MRKWGQYFIGLLMCAVLLAGCGSGDNNSANNSDSAANSKLVANSSSADDSGAVAFKSETSANASTTEALSEAESPAVKGSMDEGQGETASTDGSAANETAGFTGKDVVAGLNKKLIYRANLTMEVKDYGKAQTEVRNRISLAGGYIIEFNESRSEYEQGGTFVMKVPASGFSSFLSNLEKVAHESLQRNIQGTDVSEEYVDLESRLKAKQLMEAQYIEFMKKATKPSDLVSFANELGAIQESIEQIKGRMRYIDQNVSFSTVELRLYQTEETVSPQKTEDTGPLYERASEALKGSLNAISVMFQWIVVIVAALFPVLILAGIILAFVLLYRKSSKRKGSERSRLIRQSNRNHAESLAEPATPVVNPVETDATEPEATGDEDEEKK